MTDELIVINKIHRSPSPGGASRIPDIVTLHILVLAEDEFGKYAKVVSGPETFPRGLNARLPVHTDIWIATSSGQRRASELNKRDFLKHFSQKAGL